MDKKEFKYEIDGRTYLQRPLVLGQIDQLIECLEGMAMPQSFSPIAIKQALGEKFYTALAVVLIPVPPGVEPSGGKAPAKASTPISELLKNKDVPALAEELRWSIDHETTLEVIDHFFECNPIASILNRLTEAMLRMSVGAGLAPARKAAPASPDNGSGILSSSSVKETSPSETKSSGDILPEIAPPSPDIL